MQQKVLIWLRRFRPNYDKKFRFHTALGEACSGLAYPVTIQDRSYSTTLLGSFFGRGWFVLPVAFLAFIMGMLVIGLLSIIFLPEDFSKPAFGMTLALYAILVSFLSYKAYRRQGYKVYSGQEARLQIERELESIQSGKRRIFMGGVDVFKCDDDVWQDAVVTALSRADIALIDISEITENLEWEISQALKSLPQNRIIFVCEDNLYQNLELLDKLTELFRRIDPGLEIETIKDKIIVFPSQWAGVGPGRRRQVVELKRRLRPEIAVRLLSE